MTIVRKHSRTLGSQLRRAGDLASRYGGEELAIVLPDTNAEGGMSVGERLRASVEALGLRHEGSAFGVVTVRVGVASVRPSAETSPDRLIAAADSALYHAKRGGRNCVRVGEVGADVA